MQKEGSFLSKIAKTSVQRRYHFWFHVSETKTLKEGTWLLRSLNMIGYFWPSKSLHVSFEWIIAHSFYFRQNADVSNHRFCFLLFLAWIQAFVAFLQNFSPPLDRFWCDDLPLGQDFQSLGRILLITKNEALSYGKRPLHIFEQLSLVTPPILFYNSPIFIECQSQSALVLALP